MTRRWRRLSGRGGNCRRLCGRSGERWILDCTILARRLRIIGSRRNLHGHLEILCRASGFPRRHCQADAGGAEHDEQPDNRPPRRGSPTGLPVASGARPAAPTEAADRASRPSGWRPGKRSLRRRAALRPNARTTFGERTPAAILRRAAAAHPRSLCFPAVASERPSRNRGRLSARGLSSCDEDNRRQAGPQRWQKTSRQRSPSVRPCDRRGNSQVEDASLNLDQLLPCMFIGTIPEATAAGNAGARSGS